ncbi:CoA transferase [Acuticoccus sp. M5D2P5]|uniref:CaiB/BaiF CoA transferase family protein n=1 Tax=Acuticoccus kalidii TaxID=2910977 RepID=UPI001F278851|nr:CaiB/BaiF CoA-transferase family protein [Acuticoccus kalidii]MCF3935225.1 CoA transferase [Acuticoccus kalidii]
MLDLLDGVRVVSFNHFLLGPVAIQALGDLGADVIAVEPKGGAFQRFFAGAGTWVDDQSALLLTGNRNKRSIALDLKTDEGRAVARKLVEQADVVCENFRPGVMEKLGLGYDALKEANPGIIYASASGYGSDGPYAKLAGQDLLIQAMSGLAKITGEASTGPRSVGVSVADHHGAALLALGITSALVRRGRTGKGCKVEVNLLSAAIDLQMESFICYLNAKQKHDITAPARVGGWYYSAPYGMYPVKDGHMAISLAKIDDLARALDAPELREFKDEEAFEKGSGIVEILNRVLPQKTYDEWHVSLAENDIWHTRVNDYDDVVADPQVQHNGSFMTVKGASGSDITLVNHPVRYDGQTAEVRLPPQPLGAQTRDILGEAGYSDADIDALISSGVAVTTP